MARESVTDCRNYTMQYSKPMRNRLLEQFACRGPRSPQASVSTDTLARKTRYWTTPPHISKTHEQIELIYTRNPKTSPPRHAPQRDPDEEDVREDARVDDPGNHPSHHSE